MRKTGVINQEELAKRFSDYLYTRGIANVVEPGGGTVWNIWIYDEDAFTGSREELKRFLANPDDPVYLAAAQKAEARLREERATRIGAVNHVYPREHFFRRSIFATAPLTVTLIIFSMLATFFGGLGTGSSLTQWLSITEYHIIAEGIINKMLLPEIMHGQLWRLVTPIFIHASLAGGYGVLHLLFNMLWLKDLGGMLERVQGVRHLLVKVLVIGSISNLAQFAASGSNFGGMSGVVYGLLGYAWLRGRQDLTSGLYVHSQTMLLMCVWFFLCFSGAMGAVANAAHTAGLATGLAWGYLAAWRVNTIRR